MSAERRTPRATYRLQMRPGFGFAEAAQVADYLAELGVSHVYFSPYLQAAPGSEHGYDVVDHGRVNQELGGPEAHARMCEALRAHGLGQVIDVVPNHMSVSTRDNVWWWDVLENGPASRYAGYFDVDWDPLEEKLKNKVLMPVLGDHYGRVLEAREVRAVREGASFTVRYYDHVLPVSPLSLAEPLARAAERCRSDELVFMADALAGMPTPAEAGEDTVALARRHRDKAVIGRHLGRLLEDPEVSRAVDDVLEQINADPGQLDDLLDAQNYRLAFWRSARHDLDYRRFFDINDLAALRMDREQVFLDTHGVALRWVEEGLVDGLRIDHPDGLRDPEGYLRRLRQAAPQAWIVAEKILEQGTEVQEELPEIWPIDGTTGYDFLNQVERVFVDPRGEPTLTQTYAWFTGGEVVDFHALVRDKKRLVLAELLGSDLNRLAAVFVEVCERHRRYRDYSRQQLREVLLEVAACLPVYRTYVRPGELASERDTQLIARAIKRARADRPEVDGDLLSFLRDLLCGRIHGRHEDELVARFQQLTGPAMAKGLEDTSFYVYNRLICLNEVGGDPAAFGGDLDGFHRFCQRLQLRWPRCMLSTSTHDTKRSEDVRPRIAALSEIPERWAEAVQRWTRMAAKHRTTPAGDGGPALPDANTEWYLYQTLVGAWPLPLERCLAHLEKAGREAKEHTSWLRPDERYEEAVRAFATGLLGDAEFLADFEAFLGPLLGPARVAALGQTLIKLTAPGVPDVYQGNEVWDFSLTDPDNRRPVDFERRRALLRDLSAMGPEEVLARDAEGASKLHVTRQALELRRRRPELFASSADYQPLVAQGDQAERVVAFSRAGGAVVVAVPRWLLGLSHGALGDAGAGVGEHEAGGNGIWSAGVWGDTALQLPGGPDARYRNLLTGDEVERAGDEGVRVSELWRRFPVALLERKETS